VAAAPAGAGSILDLIGNTPVVRVLGLDTGPCELWVKLESQNPGGSIKDRIGKSMIEAAEREGRLASGHWSPPSAATGSRWSSRTR
jgi:cystathionine beta-synthase